MRILSIRGEGLASLAAPFEIDLEAEPLRGAGLFAITGETGAGKSTILDAMCLALFGKCPRLTSDGSDESVPDVSGDTFREKDPKSVLTRGAINGHAEVDFVGVDGETYRSRWMVRRARGKASGRLQNVDRSFLRVRDAKTMESGIKNVDAAVEAHLGLNYDQFRRTVLLAQGDFDAFLRANDRERAALLEKITGTTIYRQISEKVHQKHSEAQDAVRELEVQSGAIGLLDEDDRKGLEAEKAQHETDLAALQAELAKTEAVLGHLTRVETARQQLSNAQDAFLKHQEAYAQAADRRSLRDQLARIGRVEPSAANVERAQEAQAKVTQDLEKALQELSAKEGEVATAVAAETETADQFAQLEKELEALNPQWVKAYQLDEKIEQSQQNVTQMAGELSKAQQQFAEVQKELERAQKQREEKAALKAKLQEQLARLQPIAPVAANPEPVLGDLAQYGELKHKLAERTTRAEIAQEKQRELAAIEASLSEELTKLGTELEAAETNAAELRKTTSGFDPAANAKAREAFQEVARAVKRLGDEQDAVTRVSRQVHADETQITQLEAQVKALTAKREAEGVRLEERKRQAEQAKQAAALADLAQDQHAARLRAELAADEACPVCGSTEHPFADHEDGDLTALFKELTEQRAASQQKLQESQQTLETLRGDEHRSTVELRVQREALTTRLEERRRTEAALETSWQTLEKAAQDAFADREDKPDLGPTAQETDLKALESKVGICLGELEASSSHYYAQVRKLEDANTKVLSLRRTCEQKREKHGAKAKALAELNSAAAVDETEKQGLAGQLEALRGRLLTALLSFNLTEEALEADVSAVAREVELKCRHFRDASAKEKQVEGELQELVASLSRAEEREASLQATVTTLQDKHSALTQSLETLRVDRQQILGGVPTEEHEKTFRAKHQAARDAAGARKDERLSLVQEQVALQSTVTGYRRQQVQQAEVVEAAEAAFAAALVEHEVEADQFALLRVRAREELAGLEDELRALDEALKTARETVSLREKDLAATEPEKAEGVERPAFEATVEQRENSQKLSESIGMLRQKLEDDDKARAKAAHMQKAIEEARNHADQWGAVSTAIGSANGDKFQRIAQGVTLGLLVELANKQLKQLKPRYRLARADKGLGLLVLDLDMGDAPRSTRSLSGGERFLVSLSLALALSSLEGRQSFVDTLFIDEGFGSLDGETLDVAIDALEMLQGQGRKVGVISHVEAMKDRIPVQVQVQRQGGGRSRVAVVAPSGW
ncbi:AAA family ATPase [Pseudovibrio sp. SPO723]|uniref:AAA family ATPase n=1 Tax=Nesiotobacter zosterae TaxID=392721 RepID=UPI0029C32794|nr:AAA family ATPase [Pseudovibrio sp. SPO723]MDX5593989.1 AAA family ATPase [Pseudovibrio sp. SPO723]